MRKANLVFASVFKNHKGEAILMKKDENGNKTSQNLDKPNRGGFVELILLVMFIMILLKIYIVFSAWNMIEEKVRKEADLGPSIKQQVEGALHPEEETPEEKIRRLELELELLRIKQNE